MTDFPPDSATLGESKDWLRERVADGSPCPCCTQFAKVYRRKLNSTMARLLIALVKKSEIEDRWYSVRESWCLAIAQGGDLGKLVYWGLVVERPKDAEQAGRTSGYWKPSEAGVEFAYDRSKVASHVHLFDGGVVGWDDGTIGIRDALGEKFNYPELMDGGGPEL